jgi:phenylacetate-CoA ligase
MRASGCVGPEVAMTPASRLRLHGRYLGRALMLQNPLSRIVAGRVRSRGSWTPEQLDAYRRERLATSLNAAVRNLPRYRDVTTPITPDNALEILVERFPIVDKHELLDRPAEYYPNGGVPKRWYSIGRTSGTTGTPLTLFRDLASVLTEEAFLRRFWEASGFVRGQRRVTLRGDLVVPVDRTTPPFWFYNRYDRHLVISSRHLKTECLPHIAHALRDFAPRALHAYPSTAHALATLLRECSEHLEIPLIFTSSEPLYTHQRELVEDRLGGRLLDMYGMAERVALATECLHHRMHLNTDYSEVELVDDDGQATDGIGFIVGTTFHNHAMPLVRYRLSDQTRWIPGRCACGSPFPMIEPITGKYEDRLSGRTDNFVSPSIVTFAFKGLSHIRQSQVAQLAPGVWEIRIVPERGYTDADGDKILRNIRELVDASVEARVVVVEQLMRTPQGKFRWIVNESERTPS